MKKNTQGVCLWRPAPLGACCQSDIRPTGQTKAVERRGTQKQFGPKARARVPEHKARSPHARAPLPPLAARLERPGSCLPLPSKPCGDLLGNHTKLPGGSGMNLCHCQAICLCTQKPLAPWGHPTSWQQSCSISVPTAVADCPPAAPTAGRRRFKSSLDRPPWRQEGKHAPCFLSYWASSLKYWRMVNCSFCVKSAFTVNETQSREVNISSHIWNRDCLEN